MSEAASGFVLAIFAVFCRVGACVMVMPGLSSSRIPVRARLFLAIGLSLVATPLVYDRLHGLLVTGAATALVRVFVTELALGLVIGLGARLFYLMLETLINAAAQAIGLAGIAGVPLEENVGEPALVTFLLAAATLLFFLADQHHEAIRALLQSYAIAPPGAGLPARFGLTELADALAASALLSLRLTGPFLVASVLVNFAFGLANKMTPSIQIFFAAQPVLIGLGLLLMMALARPLLQGFSDGLSEFLAR